MPVYVTLIRSTCQLILCDRCRVHISVGMSSTVPFSISYGAAVDTNSFKIRPRGRIILPIYIVEYSEEVRLAKGTINPVCVAIGVANFSSPIVFHFIDFFIPTDTVVKMLTISKQGVAVPLSAFCVILPGHLLCHSVIIRVVENFFPIIIHVLIQPVKVLARKAIFNQNCSFLLLIVIAVVI